jgi:hyaluronan synthase
VVAAEGRITTGIAETPLPSARLVRPTALVTIWSLVGLAATAVVAAMILRDFSTAHRLAFAVVVGAVVVQVLLGLADTPRGRRGAGADLDVVALVPVYNEDPTALRRCLRSFLEQTRRPNAVVVVDDGSAEDYEAIRTWFLAEAIRGGVRAHWRRTENHGKRHAQVAGSDLEPNADVYITVDSDSMLDRCAVANAMRAFDDPQVQSVAGVILTTNYRGSLLARTMDLHCVALQLTERAAFSRLNSVMVNSGGCAFYRGTVLRDNIDVYLGETVFGRPMQFSDDSLLTLFALRRGRAVQQANCFAFTLMPETFDHHQRQQVRWMRGSFIRSGWRARFLAMTRAAYWIHLVKWLLYGTVTATLVHLAVTGRLFMIETLFAGAIAATSVHAVTTLRYLSIARSDQSLAQRFLTLATAPLAAVWSLTFLRVLRWYAMATFTNTGWGTRDEIEVRAA